MPYGYTWVSVCSKEAIMPPSFRTTTTFSRTVPMLRPTDLLSSRHVDFSSEVTRSLAFCQVTIKRKKRSMDIHTPFFSIYLPWIEGCTSIGRRIPRCAGPDIRSIWCCNWPWGDWNNSIEACISYHGYYIPINHNFLFLFVATHEYRWKSSLQ